MSNTLADAGLVERGYLDASLRSGATFVRKWDVAKLNASAPNVEKKKIQESSKEPF